MTKTLDILYQDQHLIAVNKPAGMLMHRSALAKQETVFLLQTLRNQIGQAVYPVHRLDRPTSGVVLFALNIQTLRLLAGAFAEQRIQKIYHAVVRGWLPEAGRIDYPLRYRPDKVAERDKKSDKPAQPAVSDYRLLVACECPWQSSVKHSSSRYSLTELHPHTGRKHQLRRHMKHIFHPILGDNTYGDHRQNKALLARAGAVRLMLHAYSLSFTHPYTQQTCHIVAPYDALWQHILTVLSLNAAPDCATPSQSPRGL